MSIEAEATIPTDAELTLERECAVAIERVNPEWLRDAKLERSDHINFITGQLAFRLQKLIWANPLGRLEVSTPASPWEHFRAVYFPRTRLGRWFLRRKPIREHTTVKSAYAAFPEAHIVYPDHLGKMVMVIRDGAIIPVQTKEKV